MTTPDWSLIDLSPDPEFIVGHKTRRGEIVAGRLPLHQATFPDLRDLCRTNLGQLTSMTPIEYNPYTQIEPNEEYALFLGETDQTIDPASSRGEYSLLDSSLASAVLSPVELQLVGYDKLADSISTFYAISFQSTENSVAFVKKVNPVSSLQRGRRYFSYDETVQSINPPALVLHEDFDAVITDEAVAILSIHSYETLASDVSGATHNVDQFLGDITAAFSGVMFSDESFEILRNIGTAKVSVAKRLRIMAKDSRVAERVTKESLEEILKKHDCNPSEFINSDSELIFDENNAEQLIDIIEGRYYHHDFTREPLRADRYRRR